MRCQFPKWWQHLPELKNTFSPQKRSRSPLVNLSVPSFLVDSQCNVAFQSHYTLSIFVPSDFLPPSGIRSVVGLQKEARRSNAVDHQRSVDEVTIRVRILILQEVESGGLVKVVCLG